MPKSEYLEFPKPKQEVTPSTSYDYEAETRDFSTRSQEHLAPTLDSADAAVIKGMLQRGDKPQDIAFYFAVNNGRISEIKSGTKFSEVAQRTENLPPAGPYPPIRELL